MLKLKNPHGNLKTIEKIVDLYVKGWLHCLFCPLMVKSVRGSGTFHSTLENCNKELQFTYMK